MMGRKMEELACGGGMRGRVKRQCLRMPLKTRNCGRETEGIVGKLQTDVHARRTGRS